jgi:hypothetical protein
MLLPYFFSFYGLAEFDLIWCVVMLIFVVEAEAPCLAVGYVIEKRNRSFLKQTTCKAEDGQLRRISQRDLQ